MNASAPITPSKAALARLARLVRDRRQRDATGLAVVEGPRAVDGALASGATLEAVFARPELVSRYAPTGTDTRHGRHPDARRLGEGYRERIGAVYEVAADTLDPLADAMNPQGVLAIAQFADSELSAAVAAERVVVLEAVRDPGNAGAVVRSAVAAGFGSVIATEGTTDLWSPKALRGAAGLTFGPAVCRGRPTAEILEALADAGHLRVRAALEGDTSLGNLPEAPRMTLVVSNEAHGPTADAVAGTDIAAAIPMRHPVDSLNVAVAAAVLMYAMQPSS
ncbi:TrmH family RNA methyltransferase [Candidatus Poriferisodalis sp.]|uniref:TrmH family RNA methyltransferase n=1 Tax=Candidatus Poriferisodalis sp. TaxID=3101277 RepID=UPI003B0157F4